MVKHSHMRHTQLKPVMPSISPKTSLRKVDLLLSSWYDALVLWSNQPGRLSQVTTEAATLVDLARRFLIGRKKTLKMQRASYYNLLGRALVSAERPPEAEAAFRQAIREDQLNLHYKMSLIDILLSQNRVDESAHIINAIPSEYLSDELDSFAVFLLDHGLANKAFSIAVSAEVWKKAILLAADSRTEHQSYQVVQRPYSSAVTA